MCAKRVKEEYEDELSLTKKEDGRQRQRLDAVFKNHQVVSLRADVSEESIHPEQQEWRSKGERHQPKPTHVKEAEPLVVEEEKRPETPNIKKEEAEIPVTVIVKSEDDEEGNGDHFGGSQGDGLLAPLSESDDITAHSSNTDNDKRSKGDRTCHTGKKHMRMLIAEKPFDCSVCGIRFLHKTHLSKHAITHIREKPFSCSVCGKGFTRKAHLKGHIRTHTGEKPFACSVCNLSFSERSGLVQHTRTHTGEKPYSCSVCDKRFTQIAALISHRRTHTGEKQFSCSICGKRFSQRCNLTTHMRTHTGEKQFSCSVCGKRFSQRCNLTTHARTHTGEKPFSCSVCDKIFSQKYQVKKHKCAGEQMKL
ncbi:gastrula zinc finger protein XlCGF17.1-like [Phycodurus eques]|uniref:gastrula zinc finger protein XlCGF17.1-like n=1 Tax=Phycodurus eques TaxID=693459 RepID=UPI002ACD760F|nr:gastrula zinc finger protein XlCGF17.1-like [Phycodurus eques]